jgi:hypothetical protein
MSTPYIYFKFLGIHSFISTLDNSATEYTLFEDDFTGLFKKHEGVLKEEDTITTGILSREGQFLLSWLKDLPKSLDQYFVLFVYPLPLQ